MYGEYARRFGMDREGIVEGSGTGRLVAWEMC